MKKANETIATIRYFNISLRKVRVMLLEIERDIFVFVVVVVFFAGSCTLQSDSQNLPHLWTVLCNARLKGTLAAIQQYGCMDGYHEMLP